MLSALHIEAGKLDFSDDCLSQSHSATPPQPYPYQEGTLGVGVGSGVVSIVEKKFLFHRAVNEVEKSSF